MTEESLKYVTDVLKGESPQTMHDWHEILGFLSCHKIAGLFYEKASRLGIPLPKKVETFLRETFGKQKRKVEFLRRYIQTVSDALRENDVEHAFLKGSVLSNAPIYNRKLYEDGERVSNDIDLFVKPNGISAVAETLKRLGFVQGYYDFETKRITEFSRGEVLTRRMNRGEVAPFVKLGAESEFPFVEIDINFSLGNTPSDYTELSEFMLDSATVYVGYAAVKAFSPELFFLHLIMHQYKESRLYFMVERRKDLDLYKLADIYYIVNCGETDMRKVKTVAEKFGVTKPLGAVLSQVGEVFGDERILSIARECGGEQPLVIDYENKTAYKWTASVRERIKSFNSEKYLKEVENAY